MSQLRWSPEAGNGVRRGRHAAARAVFVLWLCVAVMLAGCGAGEKEDPDAVAKGKKGVNGEDGGDETPRSITEGPPGEKYRLVEVFYATDRERVGSGTLTWGDYAEYYAAPGGWLAAAALLALFAVLARRRKLLIAMALGSGLVGLLLAYWATESVLELRRSAAKSDWIYGNDRGELELGVSEVSVPHDHRVGRVESPSILRLEFSEDPEKHVMVRHLERMETGAFYDELRDCVGHSEKEQLFVFVHGYNVAFEDAVKRTAQIAYDLKYDGAPICYSWPSQGGLMKYTYDETNVAWTVPHLKTFLLEVVERSGAESINLVAHSMGNRALTQAVQHLALEMREEAPRFNHVVLAAPDIDAEVFRRDIAPVLVESANQVTLYASSRDQALAASKRVHGYARAGESGEGLVVVPGVETIDVSSVDTSLVGHSYYGSSRTILADLYFLLHEGLTAEQRRWLKQEKRNGLSYWVFLRERFEAEVQLGSLVP